MPKPDNLAEILRDTLKFLAKATTCLDEAERLIDAPHMGTDLWVSEVAAWKKKKAVLINCQDE